MKKHLIAMSLSALFAAGTAPLAFGQAATINWVNPGVGSWNDATNWLTTPDNAILVPGDGYPAEVASISNGGTAFLSAPAPYEIDGVLLGSDGVGKGKLEIRTGGLLELVDADPNEVIADGTMIVGSLLVSGGTLIAAGLRTGGQFDSQVTVTGASHINISGSAILARTTRIEGPAADITIGGSAWVLEKLEAKITATTHSPIKAPSGTANIAAALEVEFSGVTPELGDSWTLIAAASVVGKFSSVSYSGAQLERGLTVVTETDAAAGTVKAVVDSRLILNIDRVSGAASIENAIGSPIAIDGYSIGSPQASLSVAGWSSLDDQNVGSFAEAAPSTTFLSELASSGSLNFTVGAKRAIGSPYDFTPVEFGQSGEDVTFEYTTADGAIEMGVVKYTGAVNSLALTIDPDSGEGIVQNQSPFTVAIDGYAISSAWGSLSVAGWTSLDDQNVLTWSEANPGAAMLSELLPVGGFTLAPNASFNLGELFDVDGVKDLRLEFTLSDGSYYEGYVVYGAAPLGPVGDTNGDGKVNLDDLNNVRNNFGSTGLGDTDGDNDVDLDDLNNVRNNFGAGGTSPVPEPSTIVLAAAGLIAFAGIRVCRRK